jgi:hypothetical protein
MRIEARVEGGAAIGELEAGEVVVLMLDECEGLSVRGKDHAQGLEGFRPAHRTGFGVDEMQRGAVEVGEGRERAGGIQREGLQKGMRGGV